MKCVDCTRDFPVSKLRFVPDGMVTGTTMKAHKAQCSDCMRKIPIDDTTLSRREPGCDDDEEYPF